MIIEVTRRNAINLQMFLEGLGYKTAFHLLEDTDNVELLVKGESDFLHKVSKYVSDKGFIPYHFTLAPSTKGAVDTNMPFLAKATQINTFSNTSGKFRLVLFEGKNNFVWKTYSEVDIPNTEITVSGRYVTSFTGFNGEILNLINYVRVK